MRYVIIFIALLMLAMGANFAQTQSSDQDSKAERSNGDAVRQNQTISVADFRTNNVIGHLGHPLGTVLRVTGKAVDGNTTRMKRDTGKTLLEIHTVNGEKMEKQILFEFHRASKSVAKPKPGEMFDYYVHEYGAFDGVVVPPKELDIDFPMIAHDGFYYRRNITIHKSLK